MACNCNYLLFFVWLLLLLSHFSCVRLCVTPEMAAYEAQPSLGFSRQEYWSGLPLLEWVAIAFSIYIDNHLKCKWIKCTNQKTQTG